MPPRKSTSRKSDVSTARIVPVEATPPKEPTPAPAADEPVAAAAEDSPGAEKKDKDKEKEKEKEKEREKEKEKERNDAIAIEVSTIPSSPRVDDWDDERRSEMTRDEIFTDG